MRIFLLLMLLVPVLASSQVLCPVCVKKDLKSTMWVGMTFCTLLAWDQYYDKKGVYHSDDPNICDTSYYCSQGHKWQESCQLGICKKSITKDDGPALNQTWWSEVAEDGLLLGDEAVTLKDSTIEFFGPPPDPNEERKINILPEDDDGETIVFASVNEWFKIYPDDGPHIAIHNDCSVSINHNSSLEKILGEFAKLISLHSGEPLCNLDGIHPGGVFRFR